MMYDDEPTSCSMCSVGLDADALCSCDTDAMCVRCHRVYHVEQPRWTNERLDRRISDGLTAWGKS